IAGCCPHARFTLTAGSRPPAPTRAINSRRLRSSMRDFLPDALSKPPTGPCSVSRSFRGGNRERGCELGHTSLLKKSTCTGSQGASLWVRQRHPAGPLVIGLRWFGACSRSGPAQAKYRRQTGVKLAAFLILAD